MLFKTAKLQKAGGGGGGGGGVEPEDEAIKRHGLYSYMYM